MKLSVLITFYNQADDVDAAMESVLGQTVDFDMEVLAGDDGSTDGTLEKLQKWKAKYPKMIEIYRMPRDPHISYNASVRASRNRLNLLSRVRGEYFIYLDGDDVYTSQDKLQKQVSALDDPQNADCVGCGHNMIARNEQTGEQKPIVSQQVPQRKYPFQTYWAKMYFHPDSLMFRSRPIADVLTMGLDDFFNDDLITFAFLQYGSLYYLNDVMAVYRLTGTGIWTGRKQRIGLIRNMTAVDLAMQIDPRRRLITVMRYRNEIRTYLRLRRLLDDPQYDPYFDLAREAGAKITLGVKEYDSLGALERMRLALLRIAAWGCAMYYYATTDLFKRIRKRIAAQGRTGETKGNEKL